MVNIPPWSVPLFPQGRIFSSPFGSDLLLSIYRGINCENHCQILSAHCTNVPDEEDVKAVVKEHKEQYDQIFEGIIASQHIPGGEEAGLILLQGIMRQIAEESEKRWWDRQIKEEKERKGFTQCQSTQD